MHRLLNSHKVLFIILLLQFAMPAAYSQWMNVGGNISQSQTYPSNYNLAVDTSGIPYVAFADLGNSYVVTVKKLNGTWTNVGTPGFITGTGSSSGLFYNPGIAIAINPVDNSPWVALADGDHENKISVMRFNGTAWVYVGSAGFTAGSSCGVKLAFTSDGTPHIVYNACYDGSGISVMRYNGSWTYAGPQNFATGNYFNMVIAPNNRVSVAYQDFDNNQKLTVRSLVSGNWVSNGAAGISDGEVQNVNITVDAGNDLYVCYVDYSLNSKLTVKKFSGNAWSTLGAATVSQFTANFSDISVSKSGVPYVSYVDGSLPTVKKYTNGAWSSVGNYVAAGQSQHTSIFNDSLGNPWVLVSLSPSLTLPFMYKYKPCNDPGYGLTATATPDSAITQTGGTTTVTVAATGGVGPYTGTGTFTVGAGYYNYVITDANGCTASVSISVTEPQPVCEENYWIGGISNDWNDTGNWSCGSLPGDITTVYVEPGATFYPLVNSDITLKQLVLSPGVTVTVVGGSHITLLGQ